VAKGHRLKYVEHLIRRSHDFGLDLLNSGQRLVLDRLLPLNQQLLVAVLRHKAFHYEVEVIDLFMLATNRQQHVAHKCRCLRINIELLEEGSASTFSSGLEIAFPLDLLGILCSQVVPVKAKSGESADFPAVWCCYWEWLLKLLVFGSVTRL
jgi:hypothetical protein